MPIMQPRSVFVGADQYNQIVAHLQSVLPREGCGLLAGVGGVTQRVFPITNVLQSENRFRMNPVEQVKAMHTIQEAGLRLLGIYHSHPNGPSQPSATDLDEAAYTEAAYLIFWPEEKQWQARGYRILNGASTPIELILS